MPWTLTTKQVSSTGPDGMTKLTMRHVGVMVAHVHAEKEEMETVVLVVKMEEVAMVIELFRAVTWMVDGGCEVKVVAGWLCGEQWGDGGGEDTSVGSVELVVVEAEVAEVIAVMAAVERVTVMVG